MDVFRWSSTNDVVTQVRQRVIRKQKGPRGRLEDLAWVTRRQLLGGAVIPGR